ncbi:MAG: type I restriction endonuclease subunit M [Elusimicrobia bacterium CG1_02_63_36]|nr:MAG: type I restriction endonuclease subunit M [Elusimicrobia bacterium CG1_02_63_36]PIR16034.1 MAG: type I restriction endonuclease subunit M [Elusimicrobia bacterium CG11_big_fil_rev_8_21_14_0_20_64_6]
MTKLDLDTLESHLLASANILRGSIDASDYKNYIFGLFFLKRISDVFDEEAEKLIKEGASKKVALEDPDEHEFFVPPKAHWKHLTSLTHNLGDAINKANDLLEEHNRTLEDVLSATDFNYKERLPDNTLSKLIVHFSKLRLRNEDLAEPDMLGRAYEYLIAQFADDAGKKGGEFYTPKEVVSLLVEILDPQQGMYVCDPACGSGGMLVQAVHHLRALKQNTRNIVLHGQERNIGTWAICKMNMLLHGLASARIEKGDTIRQPKLLQKGKLVNYDIVIANPPFSLKNWGVGTASNDPFGRFHYGLPPKSYGDFAFVQHMIATLKPEGRAGVVLPHGVLFRGGAEGKIRQGILEDDLLEAVIGLPSNLFYGASIPASLFILNKKKPAKRKGKVFFLYGARDFQQLKNKNKLRQEDIDKILKAYRDYAEIEKYCRPASLDEIRRNDYNLNIPRYVDITEDEEPIDVQKTIDELKKLRKERAEAEAKVEGYLKELGYKV